MKVMFLDSLVPIYHIKSFFVFFLPSFFFIFPFFHSCTYLVFILFIFIFIIIICLLIKLKFLLNFLNDYPSRIFFLFFSKSDDNLYLNPKYLRSSLFFVTNLTRAGELIEENRTAQNAGVRTKIHDTHHVLQRVSL